jgi:hypothetical protein
MTRKPGFPVLHDRAMSEFTGQCKCGAVRLAAAARRYATARKLIRPSTRNTFDFKTEGMI